MQLPLGSTIESEHEDLGTEIDKERVRWEWDPSALVTDNHRFNRVGADLGVGSVDLIYT